MVLFGSFTLPFARTGENHHEPFCQCRVSNSRRPGPGGRLRAGNVTITFDQPPLLTYEGQESFSSYSESGMRFTTSNFFYRYHGAGTIMGSPVFPAGNYLQGAGVWPLDVESSDGSLFGLVSVDLASYSLVFPTYDFGFVGYKPNGSTVSTSFAGGGIKFQTYQFGPEWSGLTRVEMPGPDPGSLDNLVLSIPEPGSGALFALGALSLSFSRNRRRKLP